ncbi:hypothetical protein GCM10010915_00570 [Microbacterium faecale]|uniref:RNA helicase n=1 Tax=Microbacterium faecale TaxID=1804630 RepID=A0A916Y099_9MICO|nr:DEAD/DEAH box helicase [Microbacterium faecale]GGD24500.1 hypothetical protein GCM10010915_00570 [Microbacterium faecale]
MPKSKKPAGGRPVKNFDPRYASKSGGSRKPRWSRDDRAQRGGFDSRGSSSHERDDRRFDRDSSGDRPSTGGYRARGGDDRRFDGARGGAGRQDGARRFDRDDRPRDDRGGRRFDSDNRGPRRFERDDRAPRRFDRDDRAPRRFDRDDRGPRRFDRDDRAPRRFDRDDRGPRRFDRDDRAPRRFDRDDRAPRRFDRDDRGPRRFDRDDRAPRRFDGDAREGRAGRGAPNDRGGRFDRDARGHNRFDRGAQGGGRRFDREGQGDRRRFDRDAPHGGGRFDNRAPSASADVVADTATTEGARPQTAGERAWQERRDAPQRTAQQEQQIDVVHERLTAEAVEAAEVEGQTFGDLGLGDNICRALADLGAASPFPIQAATIGPILEGKDVLGRGRTGSGKTIAFGAPMVEALLRGRDGGRRAFGRAPQALIVAPTRELALQIDRTVQPIARSVGLFTTQVYGGVPQGKQVGALKKGVDIVIGTPGRIEDLHAQGKLDLSEVKIAVLDEADHMCDLGFLEPVQRILRLTKEGGQKLLFSATLDREVSALVDEFLKDPQVYEVAGEDQDSGTIDHQVLVVDQRSKRDVIEQLADRGGRTIIFSRTRAFADQLVEQFEDADIRAIALHGDLNQAKRTRNIERFSKGRISVLVATDVAARGIHVDDVDLVVQADAPDEYKTYLHRSGRTGRAGREGRVITLIPRNRRRRMSDLLKRAEIDAPFRDVTPGDPLITELAG